MIRRALQNALLVVFAVALTLGAGELLARRLLPGWAPAQGERSFWRYDAELGWTHEPGEEGVHRHEDFAVAVRISEQGLRDRVYPKQRTPGRQRMLVLGDSFAWGQGVEREEIWHELLEARRPDWEIVNAAVAGWGTGQQLLYLEPDGLSFEPDVVVLMLHPNDFLDNNEPYRYGYFKPTFVLEGDELLLTQVPVPRLDREQRLDRWLRLHTWLLYRVYHAPELLSAWWASRGEPPPPPPPEKPRKKKGGKKKDGAAKKKGGKKKRARPPSPPRKSKYDVDLALTLRLLERMRDTAEAAGARFFVLSVPMADPPRARFAAGLEAAGIDHLLLDDAFARAEGAIRHPNDPHWTARGHGVAADAAEAWWVAYGVLEAAQEGLGRPVGAPSP